MIGHIIKDPWTWISTGMILAVQWIMAHVNILFGVLMGIGGLVTLFFRIKADIRKDRHAQRMQEFDLKIKQQELDNLKNKNTHI